ncbi:hypothetical protein TARUN_2670 [Trichoderma arundinaceum]|uniref:BZIP domain-containing protein n=1 Tax=Trichoderma arundinaceum TaxID=490622 RepID=A0A395NVQ5_TRIAR|nr:hypothetical protein TARUN_2670 [Trichoderma arundinaceum]
MTPRAYTRSSEKPPPSGEANPEVIPDLTASEIRQARRKVQNRLNQRAHRIIGAQGSRAREKKVVGGTGQPYRVHRWRVDDGSDDMPILKPRGNPKDTKTKSAPSNQLVLRNRSPPPSEPPSKDPHPHRALVSVSATSRPGRTSPSWLGFNYCLLSDHLLHLIHFNVLRGLSYNKKVIKPGTFRECHNAATLQLKRFLPPPSDSGSTVVFSLPESLTPTNLQISHPHSTWIDVFPFPKMRDNLIRWENCFDHAEFLTDLLGNLINCLTAMPCKTTHTPWGSRAQTTAREEDVDDTPTDRRGLILWGEPYQRESWEVTPGFLRRWSWVVDGCGELIESSNKWRTARGETPLRMAVLSQ